MAMVKLYPETCQVKCDEAFEVPEFTPPYPARVHPLAEKACKDANTWLLDHAVQTMFTPEKLARFSYCPMLAALAYPDATGKGLSLASKIMVLIWTMDDTFDDFKITEMEENWKKSISLVIDVHLMMKSSFPDSSLLSHQLVELLEKLPSDNRRVFLNFMEERILQHATMSTVELSPIALAYRDHWTELTSLTRGQSSLRAAYQFQEFLLSSLSEMHNRQANVLPSMEEYITLRRQTGAVLYFLVLIDIIEGETLDEEIWCSPEMQRLVNATNDFAILHNDIWSYKKECLEFGNSQNIVFLVSHYNQCSPKEAALTVTKMLYGKCEEVDLAAKELLKITEPKHRHVVNLYIRTCKDLISGTHEFHKNSIRYK
ncbi:hypothetical protein O6H91_23G055000 [Diphasiastrum complanatum]|nr:hypothetical protein O6H91_23G055000 [Diphasiastrum complanatum]KAJ7514679.1 hypothetical protein O6H91_23G055000 [Diphasiastrum complanatum]KAJ7514680.1 hypothetical protein O6H91_23G055000 [Diphasiastrum complanatum]